MKHSITFLAAAALVGATFAAKADNDIKPNPNPPPPKPSTSGSGQPPVNRVPQAPVKKPRSLELLTRAMILTLTLKRAREPAMTCFVTYLRIGTRSSKRRSTVFEVVCLTIQVPLTVFGPLAVPKFRTSELNAASEQVSAPGRKDRLKVLSTLVAAARHPAAASAL